MLEDVAAEAGFAVEAQGELGPALARGPADVRDITPEAPEGLKSALHPGIPDGLLDDRP